MSSIYFYFMEDNNQINFIIIIYFIACSTAIVV